MYKDWNQRPFSPNQRIIADFIQKNEQRVLYMTEQEVADELHLSIASVSRFWKAAGYKHVKDFKNRLRFRFESTPSVKMRDAMERSSDNSLPQVLLDNCSHHLQETRRYLKDEVLQLAVGTLSAARIIYVYSPGPCGGLAELMMYRMARFGLQLRKMASSGHELLEALMHASEQDVVLVFGFVQILPEIEVILDHAREAAYKVILITDRLVFPRSQDADIVLYAGRGEVWEFHSMVGPTYIIENLILGVGLLNREHSLNKLDRLQQLRAQYGGKLPRS
ncbi:MurR/RpiR family transcriptional regulator [Paenibacillus sp. MMS20-IR301]|uniref:MurR/RpiR family transcriptional regulator n=1 Tax=Paenibacillus sp. MMS20-IR301 TaxID=2895946 RepID=UPI0028EC3472|nr:MurR/RpiR family transcriptional regulator [Paenibacillus sp. MMS20-IR301]WNS46588.1 MurR/RpiR family transcriptional regulator [Paenibacillus sp. MMS20-IR301]